MIGATGRVGSEIVRGVLERGEAVTALVRDPGKARRAFGEPGGLHIRPTRLDDPRDLTEAFDGIRTVFIAMGSIGIEGVLQRIAINAAAGIPSIEQVTRLSVLNASAGSLGINQRAHYSIDQFASSTAVPYSTIRPAIFSASLLAAAREVRASRTWTGLAGSGRMALIDHRDAAEAGLRVLTDPALWGAHHDLTGPTPMSWPEALEVVTLPVSDVDRAKRFYEGLGWRCDADIVVGDAFRAVQLTPPHSACSIAFGKGLTTGEPGSVEAPDARGRGRRRGARGCRPLRRRGQRGVPPRRGTCSRAGSARSVLSELRLVLRSGRERMAAPGDQDAASGSGVEGLKMDIASLADLLHETAEHHDPYEKSHAPHNWWDWYAAYMTAREHGSTSDEASDAAGRYMERELTSASVAGRDRTRAASLGVGTLVA